MTVFNFQYFKKTNNCCAIIIYKIVIIFIYVLYPVLYIFLAMQLMLVVNTYFFAILFLHYTMELYIV
jgi:hypothetical protein